MNKFTLKLVLISCMTCTLTQASENNWSFLHRIALDKIPMSSYALYHSDITIKDLSAYVRLFTGEQEIDINQRDSFGATALHYATMLDCWFFEWLLKNGASPYIVDNGGWNIIHYAAACGALGWSSASGINTYADIAKLINQQDSNGDTPLHVAVCVDQTIDSKNSGKRVLFIINTLRDVCVQWLLEHGADTSIRNNEGYTPADCIKKYYDANDFYGQCLLQLIESN